VGFCSLTCTSTQRNPPASDANSTTETPNKSTWVSAYVNRNTPVAIIAVQQPIETVGCSTPSAMAAWSRNKPQHQLEGRHRSERLRLDPRAAPKPSRKMIEVLLHIVYKLTVTNMKLAFDAEMSTAAAVAVGTTRLV
jgi:hypothetical protein